MNIVVKSYNGECFVRPDTTWERDSEDFYPPEFISALSWTPVIFAHISKPGRSISERFASRYFDGIGFGALLYPDDMLDGRDCAIARASCLDHSSFLPFPAEAMNIESFSLAKDGTLLFASGPDLSGNTSSTVLDSNGNGPRIYDGGGPRIGASNGHSPLPGGEPRTGASNGRSPLPGGGPRIGAIPGITDIVKAIAQTSQIVYLRFGDIIAIELDSIRPLCKREEKEINISLRFNGNDTGDFRIIF